ncbi:MAG: peptidoglycan-binding domain-containing protein [Terriglobia bacterium]
MRRRSAFRHHRYLHVVHFRRRRTGHTRLARSRYRRHSVLRRAPALEIPPERATQIQQALIEAGDLKGQPTGRWDAQTRDAMKRYQHANGFSPTGLPDAKSLMKMGLGPHPLPRDVDPLAQVTSIPPQKTSTSSTGLTP